MHPRAPASLSLPILVLLSAGCGNEPPTEATSNLETQTRALSARRPTTQWATLRALPMLSGRTAEALAVNPSGTVIAGYAWERPTQLWAVTRRWAVKWTSNPDGSWAITKLPDPAGPAEAIARAVNRAGDVAGNYGGDLAPRIMIWPASGGFSVHDCDDLGEGHGISADGRTVVGATPLAQSQPRHAALWRPGECRQLLPPLSPGRGAVASAVNGVGTLIGGYAVDGSGIVFPVRWTIVSGQWQIEQLDPREGIVYGANAGGDLAGYVRVPCALTEGCVQARIWRAGLDVLELGTLGGEHSWARGVNSSGEVVGASTSSSGVNTGFFFSQGAGMLQLPVKGEWAAGNAISDVRADGTRLVAGMNSRGQPVAWVVRTP